MSEIENEIIHYYEACETDYRTFWDLDHSLAMHAGYWDQTTKSLREALRRENEVLAEMAGITENDHVLDAGCGVGGSAIFLADQIGCRVTGITLSGVQKNRAREHVNRKPLKNVPHFYEMDFTKTTFPDETFDVVWGLESVCHATDKGAFVREAYRLLKKGGRLIVADGFSEQSDHPIMQPWLKGWGVESLDSAEQFRDHLEGAGFKKISYTPITQHVLPSSRRLFLISIPALFFSKIGELLRYRTKVQTENIRGAYYQYRALKKGLWDYAVFLATKEEIQ